MTFNNIPRGTGCPFSIYSPLKDDNDDKRKAISFKQPIDPDGIKLVQNAKVCDSTFIEDILAHELQFSQL